MQKIVISHPLYHTGMAALEGKAELVVTNNGEADQILDALKDADAFILRIGKIGRDAISACKNLKVITRPGVGFDNVDVDAATEYGIPVVLCPAANWRAVAEHALTLLMASAKNLPRSVNETRQGNFNVRNEYKAVDVYQKTIALLGFGHIGRELGRMCLALNMDVLVYDPYVSKEQVEKAGCRHAADLTEALRQADFVSIHMPSTPDTRGLMGQAQFAAMKKTAFLINTSRGDIVNEDALLACLENKGIAGAALDVLTQEPMKKEHPLMKFDNVIITPHMAAQTQETVDTLVTMAAEGTLAVLAGEQWPHVANPEVYKHLKWQR